MNKTPIGMEKHIYLTVLLVFMRHGLFSCEKFHWRSSCWTFSTLCEIKNYIIEITINQDETVSSNTQKPLLKKDKTTKDENVDKNSETSNFEKVGNQNDASISIVLENQQCNSQTKISSPPTKISQVFNCKNSITM